MDIRDKTHPISHYNIPWESIRIIAVLGTSDKEFNQALERRLWKPGIYTTKKGNWLILVHQKEVFAQQCITRLGRQLNQLAIYHTDFVQLNLSTCVSLEYLVIRGSNRLTGIFGIEKLKRLTSLSINSCSILSELTGLEELTQLTTMSLCSLSVSELPSFEKLTQLQRLVILFCPNLIKFQEFKDLSQLNELTIYDCKKLAKLPSLDSLTQLRKLQITCESLKELPCLDNLTKLHTLDLIGCKSLKKIPSLDKLSLLVFIRLDFCYNLTELPSGITQLKYLRMLGLRNLNLYDLPDELPNIAVSFSMESNGYDSGKKKANVYLSGTTVKSIPDMSIFEQPYEVVAEWFRNRNLDQIRTLNEIKVVFLGDGEAGKSHTIARLMNDGGDPIDYTDQSTPGIVIKNKDYDLDGRKFQVHYWDFGGQEIMHSMHRIFLTNRTMYVVLLNARDDTQSDRAQYWLHNVQSFAPDAPVVLVLNKIDQNPKASVDETTLRARYPGLKAVVRMSAKEFSQEEFNREFTRVLLQEIDDTGYLDAQWPQSWIAVKKHLEEMETHYILGSAYRKLCQDCQVGNVQAELLHWFNDLGVSFCFCGEEDYELEDHVILRPDWITNGLYIILFNQLEEVKNGLIPHKSIYRLLRSAHCNPDIRCTLPNASYNNSDIHYVLGVMRKFALSFTDGNNNEFIPMLCQQESTVDIAKLEQDDQILEFRMEFEYLPDNLLHRLMVERHRELDMDKVWRKGAKFHLSELGLTAVVVIDGGVLRFFIQHTDPMHRPNTYLAMLKANVDRIVAKMGIKAPECKLVYKVHGERAVFGYDRLLKLHARGRKEEYCEALDEDFLITDILNQSAPAASEDLNILLKGMISACLHLQGNPNYRGWNENGRNCVIRDSLGDKGYIVLDQNLRGTSASGKSYGELDLLIQREANSPWVLCEALIAEGYTQKWNEHLDKLLNEYNPHGLSTLFLLTYVDCEKSKFDDIWQKYKQHILADNPKSFIRKPDSVSLDLNSSYEQIKIARCSYLRSSYEPVVYHIFVQMNPKPQDAGE